MTEGFTALPIETASLCPTCLKRLPARREVVGDRVDLVKSCPEHGEYRALIWQGPPHLSEWNRPKTPSQPPVCYGEVKKGCPFDCGLCPEHGQHSCSALLEVTGRCNLRCPVCFADSGKEEVADPPLSVIDSWYRAVHNASGKSIVIQLSGGEPTIRDDLPVIIALGRRQGFSFIQLNTNGLRLADSPYYARELKEAGLASVFLQFDGTTDAIYERLRGKALLPQKIKAIDHCLAAGLGVVLVPTVVPGVNSNNLGAILDFALQRAPGVRGVHFQPISYFGRFPAPPSDQDRMTLPQILRGIEQQTGGRMRVDNFAPPGCEHSHCSFHGNFLVNPDGSLLPLTNKDSCCCNKPTPAAEGARKSTDFLTRQWAAPQQSTPPRNGAPESLDSFLERIKTHTFAVSAMAFQDVWNIDLERARNCCIHVLTPQEKLVPFCLYNLTSAQGRSLYRGHEDAT
ncbi:MAG: radical SAM protein [Syntrophotaleaceae bacterium]